MKAAPSPVDAGLPTKLSARVGDPHYDTRAASLSERIDILLDGQVLEHATSYGVTKGEVVRHRRTAKGDLILERGAPTFEILKGRVEVRWIRAAGGAA